MFVDYIPGLILTWFHTAQIPETIKNITFFYPNIQAEKVSTNFFPLCRHYILRDRIYNLIDQGTTETRTQATNYTCFVLRAIKEEYNTITII